MTKKERQLIRQLLALLSQQAAEIILWGVPDILTERNIEFTRKELGLNE